MSVDDAAEGIKLPEAGGANPEVINERAFAVLRQAKRSQVGASDEKGVTLLLVKEPKLYAPFQLSLTEPDEKPGYQKIFSFEWDEKNQTVTESILPIDPESDSPNLSTTTRTTFTPEDYDHIHLYLLKLEDLVKAKNA